MNLPKIQVKMSGFSLPKKKEIYVGIIYIAIVSYYWLGVLRLSSCSLNYF